jgi:hypothetical protein
VIEPLVFARAIWYNGEMNLTVELPDAIAHSLQLDGPDPRRQTLEFFALQGYKSSRLSRRQVGDLLGFSFYETEEFLKANGAEIPITVEEVYRGAQALEELLAR